MVRDPSIVSPSLTGVFIGGGHTFVFYVCKRGMQKIGKGRDAARKRAGAELRKSRSLCNLGLAFALRRDGTAGGVCARGRRRREVVSAADVLAGVEESGPNYAL